LYVIEKDQRKNALIVGSKEDLDQQRLWAKNVNWVSIEPPAKPIHAQVKIRYKSSEEPAIINTIEGESVEVKFDHKIKGITPGQAAVFYNGDICLGGGIIEASN
jgi:tRNA-specific 2-thiouridylase